MWRMSRLYPRYEALGTGFDGHFEAYQGFLAREFYDQVILFPGWVSGQKLMVVIIFTLENNRYKFSVKFNRILK